MYDEIRKQLLELKKSDQDLREKYKGSMVLGSEDRQLWACVTVHCTQELLKILKQIGWPTPSKVGAEASQAAWLIAQHADHDVGFQRFCLGLMSNDASEIDMVDLAYLEDRVCRNLGIPQFYGTQFYDNAYGAFGPWPIFLPEEVDERRAEIGLNPLAEYKRELEEKYK